MPNHPPAVEDQSLEPVLGKLLSRPTTADARADYNRIVRIAVHSSALSCLWSTDASRHPDCMQVVVVYLRGLNRTHPREWALLFHEVVL